MAKKKKKHWCLITALHTSFDILVRIYLYDWLQLMWNSVEMKEHNFLIGVFSTFHIVIGFYFALSGLIFYRLAIWDFSFLLPALVCLHCCSPIMTTWIRGSNNHSLWFCVYSDTIENGRELNALLVFLLHGNLALFGAVYLDVGANYQHA